MKNGKSERKLKANKNWRGRKKKGKENTKKDEKQK